MRRRGFLAGILLGGLIALVLLSFLGCATVRTSSVRIPGVGSVHLPIDAPDDVIMTPWSIIPEVEGPHIWIAVRCQCGAVHVGLLVPTRDGAELRLWTINKPPPYGGTTEGGPL